MDRIGSAMRQWIRRAGLAALVLVGVSVSAASAETLLMPNRDFLMGASEVVWGVSTLANGTAFTLDYGDLSAPTTGNVVDRSYIAFNHTYAVSGTFTVTLTVGGESTTTTVRVFNGATLTAANLRGLNINRTIQDGLRWLWVVQEGRAANFPALNRTNWGNPSGFRQSFTALVVLAFENHGYHTPNNDTDGVGIYEKYVVARGLNYVVDRLSQRPLNVQTAGDPCVGGVGPAPCVGLYNNEDEGYSTALSALPIAGSNALSRHVPAGLGSGNGNFVAGKTFSEVLQRLANSIAWGQNDGTCIGRGGWIYSFSNGFCQESDGSTVGWDVLALLDAQAAGTTIPAFVKSEFQTFALPQGLNTDGTFDYRANNAPSAGGVGNNLARAGIGLQGLYYTGHIGTGDPQVAAGVNAINQRWSGVYNGSDYFNTCGTTPGQNKGCAYAMFNAFKALKLHNVTSLPAAPDWYGEYQDWFVANQTNPTTLTGGSWTGGTGKTAMLFSCCSDDTTANAATALLILAPVALIAPDPTLFSTIGLSHTNGDPVNFVNTDHSVTATAQSASGAPVPGVTITFQVLSGPNAGKSGAGNTNSNGQTTFTYHDDGGVGTDVIRAFIGAFGSNTLTKQWIFPVCDVDADGDIDQSDLNAIRARNGQNASSLTDQADANKDGKINVADYRFCQLHLTTTTN
jgi:hypothetical protein